MKRTSLGVYVIAVVSIILLVNCVVWVIGPDGELKSVLAFSSGFLLGMLAMYIAVHLYRWK